MHLYDRSGQTNHQEAMARYWVSRRAYYRKWYGWLGGWLFDLSRWVLARDWAQRRAQRPVHPDLQILPASKGAPTIRMPPGVRRWLVEVSLDPRFYLAAGMLGEGEAWTPPQSVLNAFGPTTYYFRVCDRDRGGAQVGVWSFDRLLPDSWKPVADAAKASGG